MRITLPSGTPAVLARPRSMPPAGPERGLVVIPDVFGLRPLYDDLCGRLARRWGMVVCAGAVSGRDLPPDAPTRLAAAREIPDADRLRDITEAAGDSATGGVRCSLIGFCQGGTYAYHAAQSDRFARFVAFYGPVRSSAGLGPGQADALDALANGRPDRVLALLGCRDPLISEADAVALEKAGVTVVRYSEAGHAFRTIRTGPPTGPPTPPTLGAAARIGWSRDIRGVPDRRGTHPDRSLRRCTVHSAPRRPGRARGGGGARPQRHPG